MVPSAKPQVEGARRGEGGACQDAVKHTLIHKVLLTVTQRFITDTKRARKRADKYGDLLPAPCTPSIHPENKNEPKEVLFPCAERLSSV